MPAGELLDLIVPFKRDVYREVLAEFASLCPARKPVSALGPASYARIKRSACAAAATYDSLMS